jgi:hypothetical protein
MATKSQGSNKQDAGCNQQCPLLASSKPVIHNPQSHTLAIFGSPEIQPFAIAYVNAHLPPIIPPMIRQSSTLLGLGCALTI